MATVIPLIGGGEPVIGHLRRFLRDPVGLLRQGCVNHGGGYTIRKGDFVLLAPSISHRMSETFVDPDRYDPDRFDPDNPTAQIESNSLIGFGGGMHRCAGVNFARMEMKVLLAILLQNFDMELRDEVRPIAGALSPA